MYPIPGRERNNHGSGAMMKTLNSSKLYGRLRGGYRHKTGFETALKHEEAEAQ